MCPAGARSGLGIYVVCGEGTYPHFTRLLSGRPRRASTVRWTCLSYSTSPPRSSRVSGGRTRTHGAVGEQRRSRNHPTRRSSHPSNDAEVIRASENHDDWGWSRACGCRTGGITITIAIDRPMTTTPVHGIGIGVGSRSDRVRIWSVPLCGSRSDSNLLSFLLCLFLFFLSLFLWFFFGFFSPPLLLPHRALSPPPSQRKKRKKEKKPLTRRDVRAVGEVRVPPRTKSSPSNRKKKKGGGGGERHSEPHPPSAADVFLFFYLFNHYSHATYLDRGEIMYSQPRRIHGYVSIYTAARKRHNLSLAFLRG